MICGPQENVSTVCLVPEDSPDSFREKMVAAIQSLDASDGILVLGDLCGGTPCNVTASLTAEYRYECILGMNLPMLLEVLTNRDGSTPVQELAALAEQSGKAGVVNLLQMLRQP